MKKWVIDLVEENKIIINNKTCYLIWVGISSKIWIKIITTIIFMQKLTNSIIITVLENNVMIQVKKMKKIVVELFINNSWIFLVIFLLTKMKIINNTDLTYILFIVI